MMDTKEVLLLWFISSLIKKTSGSGANNKIKQNQRLPEELHKPIIRKFKKKKNYIQHLKTIFGVLILQICN